VIPSAGLRSGPAAARRTTRQLDDALLLLCGVAWAAGLIHIQAAISHADGAQLQATLFVILATAQLCWGALLYQAPSRGLLRTGAVMSIAAALVWLASRTSGIPVGPGAWTPEPVGALDVAATLDEVVLALLACLRLRGRRDARRSLAQSAVVGAAILAILLSSLALASGAHGH
jgi:hypothetical protein